MKSMKKILTSLSTILILSTGIGAETLEIEVRKVGASNNSNTVFVKGDKLGGTCPDKQYFRLPDNDKHAEKLYATALTAMTSKKKLEIIINDNECIAGSSIIKVFSILD